MPNLTDHILTLSNRDFHTLFESAPLLKMSQTSTQIELAKLSDIERDNILNDLYDRLLEKYKTDLDINYLTTRLTLVSNFFKDIQRINYYIALDLKEELELQNAQIIINRGNLFSGYTTFFEKMCVRVHSSEHHILWAYIFDVLNNCLLHPIEKPDDALEDYFKLGAELLPILNDDVEWWLPMYLGIDILQLPENQIKVKELLKIPEKYKYTYDALGLSIAEVYIHYKKTKSLEHILTKLEHFEIEYNGDGSNL